MMNALGFCFKKKIIFFSRIITISDFQSNQYFISSTIMISDVQLAIVANILNVSVFLLIILYHYINSSNVKAKKTNLIVRFSFSFF